MILLDLALLHCIVQLLKLTEYEGKQPSIGVYVLAVVKKLRFLAFPLSFNY